MHIVDARSSPPIQPLDVLFYIGLGIIAAIIVSFSVYISMKIYVLLANNQVSQIIYISYSSYKSRVFLAT
jgi:hypothetical protein